MFIVKNKEMKKIGIIDTWLSASVDRSVNEIWEVNFTLSKSDPKNNLCSHFNYIDVYGESGRYYGMYRIMPTETVKNTNDDTINYTCEHVLATLLDDVMEGYYQYSNYSTEEVMQRILSLQDTERWVVGNVEFERYFHYSFENENGLLAPILSIPQSFNEAYQFTFDTQSFPWVLNLVKPSNQVKSEIRWGKNMVDFSEVSDPTEIVNYIIPKGSGEGVNQLDISKVNNGSKYLKDDQSIEQWGKKSYIWIDTRFEDAQSLKDNAQALLDKWKNPKISFDAGSKDLSVLPRYSHERTELNALVNIVVEDKKYKARVVKETINDLAKEENATYEINNRINDIATTQTDIKRKINVNEAYSQGATNILNFGYQDNCDSEIPALIPFYIDDDVVNVNACELTFRTRSFRAYSQATHGDGGIATSTADGGGDTTSSGGGSETTSASGGGTSTSTASGGSSTISSDNTASDELCHYASPHDEYCHSPHSHAVNIPSHTHDFSIPSHTHNISIPDHTHEIPDHTHEIELPDHTHEVEHKITELDETANNIEIKVDGNVVPHSSTSGDRIDIVDYIQKDSNGKISRGRHEVEISPDSLARIEADLILRVFIRSHIGGAY